MLGRLLAAMVLAPGCSGLPPESDARGLGAVAEPWVLICPPVIGGAEVIVERNDGGVGLVLTAAPAMAEDVSDRVRRLGAALTVSGGAVLGARVRVSPIEGGARLAMETPDHKTAARLGDEVAALLRRMQSGGCPPLPARPRTEPSPPPEARQPSGHHH